MKQKGYSLIELMVVLVIFSIIVSVTVDIFISIVRNQRGILAEQELTNQTNYALGYMSRALKSAVKATDTNCLSAIGYIYEFTDANCPNGTLEACNGVKFINSLDNNACQQFFLDKSVSLINPPLREIKNGSFAQNLISDKFKIKYGRFIINGDKALHVASGTDSVKPRITILLNIETDFFGTTKEKVTQATVSQRN